MENIIKRIENLEKAFGELTASWDDNQNETLDAIMRIKYPFEKSFDDVWVEVMSWRNNVNLLTGLRNFLIGKSFMQFSSLQEDIKHYLNDIDDEIDEIDDNQELKEASFTYKGLNIVMQYGYIGEEAHYGQEIIITDAVIEEA